MEYTFSKTDSNKIEILRIKSRKSFDLSGFQMLKQEYSDSTIIDNFYIKRKIKSEEDSKGNYYEWYEITNHTRVVDKIPELQSQIDSLLVSILEV